MIHGCVDWVTFRVVARRREIRTVIAPLSLVSFWVELWVKGGVDVLWVC